MVMMHGMLEQRYQKKPPQRFVPVEEPKAVPTTHENRLHPRHIPLKHQISAD